MRIINRLTILLFILLAILPYNTQAQYSKLVQDYINKYRDIAITEMQRTGIPASIKLAQGIMESGAGQSDLAIHANNHFGIKCGGDWMGHTYSKNDDEYDSTGTIKPSCFRKYDDATESYIAHSEFLRNPAKNSRYGFLFNLDPTDYKSWAYGLKDAGYATNPQYAHQLIQTIEKYNLHQYDLVSPDDIIADASGDNHHLPPAYSQQEQTKQRKINKVSSINDVKFVLVKNGSTLIDLAKKYDIRVRRLQEYNPHIQSTSTALDYETKVYLSPLRNSFRGKNKWHYVKRGENTAKIADMYAITETSLRHRNHLKADEQPAIGERIALRGLAMFIRKPIIGKEKESILPDKPILHTPDPDHNLTVDNGEKKVQIVNNNYYMVQKGDTLYSISRKYNLDIDKIRELNNLTGNDIKIGQTLKVN